MTQLQRDKTFEPSGVQGKLKIVLHDVDTLCKQLERLYNVVSAEKVGRRRHAERA